ncbi:hypothetical protein [Endozoicomonas elysicola]|uniref:Porin n=1 Tax=Endozoicomonas elysicola TaxID=305900 RepID=A0A081KBI2_9GAMM|nr:hypothetical protein [Endozoicomonas elysicola]KEI71508.1 hypothetical protein GV64_12840 [Endozoicomonas elysicola]
MTRRHGNQTKKSLAMMTKKRVLIPVLMGAVTLPGAVTANTGAFDLPELSAVTVASADTYKEEKRKKKPRKASRSADHFNPGGVQAEDLQDIGEFGEIIQAEAPGKKKRPGFKRTRILSGIEYTKTVFDNKPRLTNLLKIYADGNTLITDNFRLSYVLSERDQTTGQYDEEQPGRLNINLTPRYEQWVSPRLNYFVAAGYKRAVEADEGKEEETYRVKPGVNFNFGKNFFGLTGEYNYKHHNGYYGFSVEGNYIYRWKPNINVGVKGAYSEAGSDSDNNNKNIRALINYRFKNKVRMEWSVVRGRDGADVKGDGDTMMRRGYDYTYYNMNTNIPINDTFSLVANVAYRTGEQYNPSDTTGGDKDIFFGKLAIISSF